MASGIFAILDDIATLMDDIAVMSKVAARKTAGLLGDDLAVNAEKASGFVSSRELPVLWSITKGSFLNKLIILPVAFLLSAFLPWAVTVILLIGGLYLAFEGAEKVYHFFVPHKQLRGVAMRVQLTESELLAIEKKRIKSAILTDFILSIEIIIITLGTVVGQPILTQIVVVTLIALLATIGVYGIVALIIRMDEFGYHLIEMSKRRGSITKRIGFMLVRALPYVIKALSIIGTIAMILVAGGIFTHSATYLHHILPTLPSVVLELLVGLVIGAISLALVKGIQKIWKIIKKEK